MANKNLFEYKEAVVQSCSVKKTFLEISKNSQENTLLKKRLWYRCFSVKFCEVSKNTFSYRNLRWLLLFAEGTASEWFIDFISKCSYVTPNWKYND